MINPVQFILGWFGYCKIPLEVVQLSIEQENFFRQMISILEYPQSKELFSKYLTGQEALTKFLRSGRKLG